MQVRADQIEAQLARGLKPLYTVHGDEPLLAQEAGDAIRAAARAAGYGERKVFTVSGAHFDWSSVLGAAQSMVLGPRDICFPTYRVLSWLMARGYPLIDLVNQIFSNERDPLRAFRQEFHIPTFEHDGAKKGSLLAVIVIVVVVVVVVA